jgi:hypothetical protein
VGRWCYRRLPLLGQIPATQLPLAVEVLALRVLVAALLFLLVVETVLLILSAE